MITWKLWDCHVARIEANIIIPVHVQYHLFPHWLSTDRDDDDHCALLRTNGVEVNVVQRTQAYCLNVSYSETTKI